MAAKVQVMVIHGVADAYPSAYAPIGDGAAIPDPDTPPGLAVLAAIGSGIAAGTYEVSYTYLGLALGETRPSPVATIAIGAGDGIAVTTPPTPANAGAVAVYWNAVGVGRRKFGQAGGPPVNINSATFGADEPPANTTLTPLRFNRADDEGTLIPVPIAQAYPTSTYSHYKSLRLVVVGADATSLTNLAVVKVQHESVGLRCFWRSAASYTRCSGEQGGGAGQYPPDDRAPRNGPAPNTPTGYGALALHELTIWDAGPHSAASLGPKGRVLELAIGLSDKRDQLAQPGLLTMPELEFRYDES